MPLATYLQIVQDKNNSGYRICIFSVNLRLFQHKKIKRNHVYLFGVHGLQRELFGDISEGCSSLAKRQKGVQEVSSLPPKVDIYMLTLMPGAVAVILHIGKSHWKLRETIPETDAVELLN